MIDHVRLGVVEMAALVEGTVGAPRSVAAHEQVSHGVVAGVRYVDTAGVRGSTVPSYVVVAGARHRAIAGAVPNVAASGEASREAGVGASPATTAKADLAARAASTDAGRATGMAKVENGNTGVIYDVEDAT